MRLGIGLTKELLFTGRWLSGREAYERGLAVKVVPDADLEATVDELAQHIAIVPVALLSVVKQAVNEWADAGGLRLAALRGADYHAIYHQASEWAAPPERREVHNDEH
jgi:enoyl-CoA hydratase/carnithine racemase